MKVLGFDSWTRGSHHFDCLVPAFEARGMSLKLVHLGSWGNDPGRVACEKIGRLVVRDIGSYGHRSLDKILAVEKPNAVIFLWTETFAHRAFNRFCRQRGIPTLYLFHGIEATAVGSDSRGGLKVNPWAYARFVLSKIYKTFRYTLPCYVGALTRTRASGRDWERFLTDLIRMGSGGTNLVAAEDARTTRCCVYTQADIQHAILHNGFLASDVTVVGNPDLVRFGLKQEMIGSRVACSGSGNRKIMYIDTGLVATGLIFKSKKEFIEHLKQTANSLAAQGIKMLCKLKPHSSYGPGSLAEQLKGSNVELVANDKFLQRLESCTACIVEITTLAMVPALMGMSLLYANYGKLKGLRFGPVFTSYPRGFILENVSDVSDILQKDAESLDPEAVRDWIAFNAGPLPAEGMPDRVADVVKELIRYQN